MSDLYLKRPERLRFRFGLRPLFALLTLFGVLLGVQVKWIRDRARAHEELNRNMYYFRFPGPAPWSIRIMGAEGASEIQLPPYPKEAKYVERFRRLYPEARLRQFGHKWEE